MFVTNWDTARNQGALTYKDGAKYQLANAFMLAYDYGTPRLLSDYKWDDGHNDDGAPGADRGFRAGRGYEQGMLHEQLRIGTASSVGPPPAA